MLELSTAKIELLASTIYQLQLLSSCWIADMYAINCISCSDCRAVGKATACSGWACNCWVELGWLELGRELGSSFYRTVSDYPENIDLTWVKSPHRVNHIKCKICWSWAQILLWNQAHILTMYMGSPSVRAIAGTRVLVPPPIFWGFSLHCTLIHADHVLIKPGFVWNT